MSGYTERLSEKVALTGAEFDTAAGGATATITLTDLDMSERHRARVIFIAQNYIIADPLSPPESGLEAIRLGLRMVSESEDWEVGILGQALLYILDRLEEIT